MPDQPQIPKLKTNEENVVLEAIATMEEPYRTMGARIYEIIKINAPILSPRLWYGMGCPRMPKKGKSSVFSEKRTEVQREVYDAWFQ